MAAFSLVEFAGHGTRRHVHPADVMARGFTLIELMLALGVMAVVSLAAVAQVDRGADYARAVGAARYTAAKLQRTRFEAVRRHAFVAVRIDAATSTLRTYVDGNGDGVLSSDIADGVDTAVGVAERIDEQFPGVHFGALPLLPAADGGTPPGDDPVRMGASDMASFSPLGTSTSGTLYLRSGAHQVAVRIYGATGRTRVFLFEPRTRVWLPLAER